MKCKWILIFLLAAGTDSKAGGFRCGTRLVITGDPVSRLLKSCGEPAYRYQSKGSLERRGSTRKVAVTQWVYERGRKRNMVVSVHGGRVIRIEPE